MKSKLTLAVAVVALTAVIVPLALATRQGAIPPNSVVFAKGQTALKIITVKAGSQVDVVWKGGRCSDGYVSPPVAFTWSGPTESGGTTDATGAPNLLTCATGNAPNDVDCGYPIMVGGCFPTYTAPPKPPKKGRAIPDPAGSENANLFLYKRTILYANVMNAGEKTWTKVQVPRGVNAVHWYGADGG